LLVPLLLAAPLAFAQGNYTELNTPQPVEAQGGKIDVVEFFWYGCIHCYNLEPALESWLKKLPPDVQFRRVPAVFNPRWGHDAAIFYTFEAMGLLDKLHKPLFDAIHRGGLRTDNPQALDQWLQKQGVEPKKFNETMKSFAVQSKTRRAVQLTTGYGIEGTPAMAVQGRYVVNAGDGILQTVSGLVDRARKEK
jgi:thiol:disulfide interchange protein DsbA